MQTHKLLLCTVAIAIGVSRVYADSVDDRVAALAVLVKADETQVYAHSEPTDSDRLGLAAQATQEVAAENRHRKIAKLATTPQEALRLAHDREQRLEMQKLDEKVAADYKKQREVARKYALEEAEKWSSSASERIPNKTSVTTDNHGGRSVTQNYDNEKPMGSIGGGAVESLKAYFKFADEKEAEEEARQKEAEKEESEQAGSEGLK
jgi:hypothetical protein